ncbi:hypothetical protein CRG98_000942 [Punica granatum]|uniref:Uncharacterized protein n=1 Tax=Punica granatum TaxID=22663 RepID=A0A2I0LDG4_PUNGR|nr:hypothetical protein CRG98_000942 [Punica granatum]
MATLVSDRDHQGWTTLDCSRLERTKVLDRWPVTTRRDTSSGNQRPRPLGAVRGRFYRVSGMQSQTSDHQPTEVMLVAMSDGWCCSVATTFGLPEGCPWPTKP